MQQFGHRAESSWELFSPRWRDNPDVVKVLAMAAGQHEDPARMAAQQAERAQGARANLSGWLGALVGITQKYLLLRENQRFHFDRLLDVWAGQLKAIEESSGLDVRYLEATEAGGDVVGRTRERLLQRVWPSGRKPGMRRRSVEHRVMSHRCFSSDRR